jgi:hypothetical protein
MNPGKAMAQAAHAANCFISRYGQNNDPDITKGWMATDRPFGTTIVLGVTLQELKDALHKALLKNLKCGEVYDDTYPYVTNSEIAPLINVENITAPPIYKDDGRVVMFRKEFTCGYIFIQQECPYQEEIVNTLSLYP